jgi:hypothetical protein
MRLASGTYSVAARSLRIEPVDRPVVPIAQGTGQREPDALAEAAVGGQHAARAPWPGVR